MTTDQLKKQARQHEHHEDWEKALAAYRQALEIGEENGEPEIALFNRVADLAIRVGNVEEALGHYDRAIDLYLEADLPNNAIAICRKVLRNVPGRAETFLQMGQIRARQGFAVDARQNVLTYAEMMEAQGEQEAATEALEELVKLFPDDVESRVFLGERLVGLGAMADGVHHLLGAWAILARKGSEEAEVLAERIRTLEPEAEFPALDEEPAGKEEKEELPSYSFGGGAPTRGAGATPEFSLEDDEPEGAEAEPATPEASTELPDPDPEPEEAYHPPELPDFTFGEIQIPGEGEAGEAEAAEPALNEAGAEHAEWTDGGLDGMDADAQELDLDEEEGDDLPPLPLLGEEPAAERREDGGSLDAGLGGFALPEPGTEEPGDRDPLDDPDSPESLARALETEPDRLDLHDLLVERAQDAGDRALLVRALRGQAAALGRAGDPDRAAEVHEQVLQLDPRDGAALAALGRSAPGSGGAGAAPAAQAPASASPETPQGGFVDLGALVLDDVEMPTTRWVVEDERSGDEDADFAHMLSKFKAKVAQHITRDDARASYDLGTAYREMGLTDEAIGMFQQALRSQPGHLASLEMLGQCFLDREEPEVALRVLERALKTGVPVEDDLLGIYYFLGVAHERAGNRAEAREFYEKVFSLDINFKDVTERLRALR
jgi:tetratricopeptide (TPR) repeat protein